MNEWMRGVTPKDDEEWINIPGPKQQPPSAKSIHWSHLSGKSKYLPPSNEMMTNDQSCKRVDTWTDKGIQIWKETKVSKRSSSSKDKIELNQNFGPRDNFSLRRPENKWDERRKK